MQCKGGGSVEQDRAGEGRTGEGRGCVTLSVVLFLSARMYGQTDMNIHKTSSCTASKEDKDKEKYRSKGNVM